MFYSFIIESIVLSILMAVFRLQLTSAKSIPTVAFEYTLYCANYSALCDMSYFSDVQIIKPLHFGIMPVFPFSLYVLLPFLYVISALALLEGKKLPT